MRPKVLVFCDFYLPGFKSGGGMWTVVNLVDRFCDRYDFYVVTRNHDGRSDRVPYPDVITDDWNVVGNARVFYASSASVTTRRAAALAEEIAPDLVFLNSVFSGPVLTFLNARRKGLIAAVPVLLAPCGELSNAALGLKSVKKRSFLWYARVFGLYRGVVWKATSNLEEAEIRKQVGAAVEVVIAPDLAPKAILPAYRAEAKPAKRAGAVKLCFVSRLTRKKNLLYLLERLLAVEYGEVSLEVIGPIEDAAYWAECEAAIRRMPRNISVTVTGPLPLPQILQRLVDSHFFVLPTLNENFGYVFLEALAAGCPILVSDQTVWGTAQEAGFGWVSPLQDKALWEGRLREAIMMDSTVFENMSRTAREYAVEWLSSPEHERETQNALALAIEYGGKEPKLRRKPALP